LNILFFFCTAEETVAVLSQFILEELGVGDMPTK